MYVPALFVVIACSYVALYFFVPWFFSSSTRSPRRASRSSIALIVALIGVVAIAVVSIPDAFWANRVLHIFGGGFLMLFVYFRAVRDAGMEIDRIRFLIFGFLLVTSLGVGNELMEFFLQTTTHTLYAASITDTWLDLLSNTVGIAIGALVVVPFIPKKS